MTIYFLVFPLVTLLNLEILNKDKKIFRVLSLIILIIFIGLRDGVGVDYFNYKDIFLSGENASWIEPGYFYLMKFVHLLGGNFYWITSLVACSTLLFLYKGLENLTPYFAFSIFLFLVLPSGYGFTVNGMRQGITAAIFLYSVKFIITGNFWKYALFILFASSIHISTIILLPFYFVRKIKFRKYLYLLIILISIILNQIKVLKDVLLKLLSYTPWESYLKVEEILGNTETSTGLGFLFINILGLLIIYFVPQKIVLQKKYSIIFTLFAFFLILRNLLFSVAILYRMVVYFDWISFLVIPIFIYFTFDESSRKLSISLLLILFSVLFYKALINPTYMLEYKFIDIKYE